MKKYYTGIGSRKTPKKILEKMQYIANILAQNNYILRSGGADSADTAFENGCDDVNGEKEIYIPWNTFNDRYRKEHGIIIPNFYLKTYHKAENIALKIHPTWYKLSKGAKKLHTRNIFQILGENLDSKSKFVICWTPNGKLVGGTATAIKLAIKNNIPVYNLAKEKDNQKLNKLLEKIKYEKSS